MSYMFEDDLINKLREYNRIVSQITILEETKEEIRKQVRRWREINKIDGKITISDTSNLWTIDMYKQHRRNIIDYEVLINKLGSDAPIFIKESESEVLKITSK